MNKKYDVLVGSGSVQAGSATILGSAQRHVEMLYNPDAERRLAAVEALGRLDPSAAPHLVINGIIDCLNDQQVIIICAAAESLGQLASVAAVPALIKLLRGNSSPEPRRAAALALGQIGSKEPISELLSCLENDDSPDVRASAADAVGMIGSPTAVEALLRRLDIEPEPATRDCIVLALARLGSDEAIHPLNALLLRADERLRPLVHFALDQIRSSRQRSPHPIREPIPASVPIYSFDDGRGGANEADKNPMRIPTVLTKTDGQEQDVDLEVLKSPQYSQENKRARVTLRLAGEIPEDISRLHVSALVGERTVIRSFDDTITLGKEGDTFEFEIPEQVQKEWCKMPRFRLTPAAGAPGTVFGNISPRRPMLAAMCQRVIAWWREWWRDLTSGLGVPAVGART